MYDRQRQNGGGDGTSSGGTASPDAAFHRPAEHRFDDALLEAAERKGVVILTSNDVESGSSRYREARV